MTAIRWVAELRKLFQKNTIFFKVEYPYYLLRIQLVLRQFYQISWQFVKNFQICISAETASTSFWTLAIQRVIKISGTVRPSDKYTWSCCSGQAIPHNR